MLSIRKYRLTKGLTQDELGALLGVSGKTVSSWEVGNSEPKMGMISKMARIFGVNNSDIIDDLHSDDHVVNRVSGVQIRILGLVPAGIPIEAIEDVIGYEEIDSRLASTGKFFGLRIQGDSMSPKIMEGDIVIVKQQDDVDSGETAIVIIDGHDATCKRVIKNDLGLILQPTNPTYEPVQYDHESIKKTPIRIIGKVVELRRKF